MRNFANVCWNRCHRRALMTKKTLLKVGIAVLQKNPLGPALNSSPSMAKSLKYGNISQARTYLSSGFSIICKQWHYGLSKVWKWMCKSSRIFIQVLCRRQHRWCHRPSMECIRTVSSNIKELAFSSIGWFTSNGIHHCLQILQSLRP